MDLEVRLIFVYLTVCNFFSQVTAKEKLRKSLNVTLNFTDEEVFTLYIFGIISGSRTIKHMHQFACVHLKEGKSCRKNTANQFATNYNQNNCICQKPCQCGTLPLLANAVNLHNNKRHNTHESLLIFMKCNLCAKEYPNPCSLPGHPLGDLYHIGSAPKYCASCFAFFRSLANPTILPQLFALSYNEMNELIEQYMGHYGGASKFHWEHCCHWCKRLSSSLIVRKMRLIYGRIVSPLAPDQRDDEEVYKACQSCDYRSVREGMSYAGNISDPVRQQVNLLPFPIPWSQNNSEYVRGYLVRQGGGELWRSHFPRAAALVVDIPLESDRLSGSSSASAATFVIPAVTQTAASSATSHALGHAPTRTAARSTIPPSISQSVFGEIEGCRPIADSMDTPGNCPICVASLNQLKAGDKKVMTNCCGHFYHYLCLLQSVEYGAGCPDCRNQSVRLKRSS